MKKEINYNTTIAYDSPSGTINTGKLEPPFQRVDKDFGFVGVLAIDTGTGKIQCHACGRWLEQLGSHLARKHGINGDKYRDRYGLYKTTALKSMRLRVMHSRIIHRLQEQGLMQRGNTNGYGFQKGNKEAGNHKGVKHPAEKANRHGVCELQVAEKIKRLAVKLSKTPTISEVVDEYGGGLATLIHYRYGGYIKLVRLLGLQPVTSNYNPKYSRQYFIDRGIAYVQQTNKLPLAKKVLNPNEQRHVYRFFKSWPDFTEGVMDQVLIQENI